MAATSSKPGEMIVGINVTPMVDVVLVLLIILMVTASYTVSKAVPLELPRATTGESAAESLAISVDKDGGLFSDGEGVSSEGLRARVRSKKQQGAVSVLIAADGRAAHRNVVRVIDLLRSEGVTKFAINVAPEDLSP